MSNQTEAEFDSSQTNSALSRRQILLGAATAALAVSVPAVMASTGTPSRRKPNAVELDTVPTMTPIRRYMAASVCLPDGRVLITGGFNQKWSEESPSLALNSAMLMDPYTGETVSVAPMNLPRARHAAVALRDGRVVVIGGISRNPTASVEVYDPRTNEWQFVESLNQPRYDHSAAYDGANIFILGGSFQSMLSGVEVIRVTGNSQTVP